MAAFERRKDVDMADSLPAVPEGGFTGHEHFEAWLTSLPEDKIKPVAQILSCRATLRVLTNIHLGFSGNKGTGEAPKELTLATLRAL